MLSNKSETERITKRHIFMKFLKAMQKKGLVTANEEYIATFDKTITQPYSELTETTFNFLTFDKENTLCLYELSQEQLDSFPSISDELLHKIFDQRWLWTKK